MSEEERESIFIRGESGVVMKMDLPLPEAIADRLTKGYLTRVANEDGDPYDPEAETDEGSIAAPVPVTERPTDDAPRAEWIGYAVSTGTISPDDAEALTTDDLRERFGDLPPATPAAPSGT